jgi:hypothetical protein
MKSYCEIQRFLNCSSERVADSGDVVLVPGYLGVRATRSHCLKSDSASGHNFCTGKVWLAPIG